MGRKGKMLKIKLTPDVDNSKTWEIQEEHMMSVILTSERLKEKEERKTKKVILTHHSASCCRGVAERFIDHLRMHSVSGRGG